MKKSSGSSQQGAPQGRSELNIVRSGRKPGEPLSEEAQLQIESLRQIPEEAIDFLDIPQVSDHSWHIAWRKTGFHAPAEVAPVLMRRQLTLVEAAQRKPVDVEIGPLRTNTSDASCHVRIIGPDGEINYDIYGVYSVQAVQLALRFTGSELDRLGGDGWEFSGEHGHGFDRLADLRTA